MLLMALAFVAAVPVNTVDQTTTGVAVMPSIIASLPVTSATNLLYATMIGGALLLTALAITMRRKSYSLLQRGRGLLATVWTKWKTHGSLASGSQLLFPIADLTT